MLESFILTLVMIKNPQCHLDCFNVKIVGGWISYWWIQKYASFSVTALCNMTNDRQHYEKNSSGNEIQSHNVTMQWITNSLHSEIMTHS